MNASLKHVDIPLSTFVLDVNNQNFRSFFGKQLGNALSVS